jgi:hypothetical protein
MTFGWSLRTTYGKRLVTCGGPGFGPSSSHRAEGTGMLSGAKFLYHLSHYTGIPLPNECHLFSDNKGLLLRTKARLQYDKNYPNATLAPDWDLIEELCTMLQAITSDQPHFQPSIEHVKGHQDDHAEYADLPLDAQMNVEADHEAENFYHHPNFRHHPLVPMFPSTNAQLVIDGTTITGHYRKHIRTAAASPEFWAQCCKIQGWSTNTLKLVDKPLLGHGVRSHCHKPQFVVKWLHHLLPTQELKSRWEYCTSQCPRCHQLDDQQHFLRCTAAPVATWRSTFLTTIRQWMIARDTNFELMSVLIDALLAWLQHTTIMTDSAPFQCRPAMHEQNELGWDWRNSERHFVILGAEHRV